MNAGATFTIDRRHFLAGSTALAGALVVTAGSDAAAAADSRPLVLLIDPRQRVPSSALASWRESASGVLEIAGDPVRLWRSEAGTMLRERATRLVGFTAWPDLLVFRGLAAESRRHLRHEQLDTATGVFSWLIA